MNSPRVGPYELERPLGAGGMAETFVAVRRGPGGFEQRVCVKRILPGRAADPRFVELFLDEARLLAKLRNAAIVQVYDFGEADGTYYMALELIDGMDLEGLLHALRRQNQRLPWPLAVYVVRQVLSALHYAHGLMSDGEPLRLVHRDISPSNVLLSQQGEVKLSDFGIAKAQGRQHKTATGFTKGKVAYMSPEQVQGEELDCRSDLFAVGVLLYEMVAGVHPFDAATDLALLNNILSGNCKPLAELVPDLPESVASLAQRLLSKSRADRPTTPGEAVRALDLSEQAFVLQECLSALVAEHRPARLSFHSSLRPSANDGSTQVLPQRVSDSAEVGTTAKQTSEVSLRRRGGGSRLGFAIAAGVLALAGIGVFAMWPAKGPGAPPAPPQVPHAVSSSNDPPAPTAPASDPPGDLFDDASAMTAPVRVAPSEEPSNDAYDAKHGIVLHAPDANVPIGESAPNTGKTAADTQPAKRARTGEQRPHGKRTALGRSGANVSKDDF